MQISIQQVLAEISDTSDFGKTFTIDFVRSTGQGKGTIAKVAKARYGAPIGNRRAQQRINGSKEAAQSGISEKRAHVENGTVPMTDTEHNRYFTPLISHIIGYNGLKVIH
jgi:hypothetical protein